VRLRRLRLCLRLRGWWSVSDRPDRPGDDLARELAHWLRGPRSRALRRAGIGRRQRVLELGSGHGIVTEELARRAPGMVVALDREPLPHAGEQRRAWRQARPPPHRLLCIGGDARRLPFAAGAFDLVFSQNTLMWVGDAAAAVAEATRVLAAGGALVALEPDYGGMLEEPDLGLRVMWLDALERAGADPLMGRRLPRLAEETGLRVWVEMAHIPRPAELDALRLLQGLPLTVGERRRVEDASAIVAEARGRWSVFLHVPYVLLVAERP